jgi:hypothetical protein
MYLRQLLFNIQIKSYALSILNAINNNLNQDDYITEFEVYQNEAAINGWLFDEDGNYIGE